MAPDHERVCAGCGHPHPAETMIEVDDDHHLCERCDEESRLVHLDPDLGPPADDAPTPPLGDPGEAGRSDAA